MTRAKTHEFSGPRPLIQNWAFMAYGGEEPIRVHAQCCFCGWSIDLLVPDGATAVDLNDPVQFTPLLRHQAECRHHLARWQHS